MSISVVVISYNQLHFIQRLVEQLLDQDYQQSDYEIVVVECASSDGTFEWLSTIADKQLRIVKLDQPGTRSSSRNHGIRSANGEIVVMIDGDHTVQRDFVTTHHRAHQRGLCAIVGKSVFANHDDFVAINSYLNDGGAAKLPRGAKLPGRYFLTRNCSVPKQALMNIGLFDEAFDQWGGEDLDLGVRIEQAGIPIYGEPDALAVHHHFRSINAVMDNMAAYGSGSVPILLRKHPQLFRELNLDRLLSNPFEADRYSALSRMFVRLLCSTFIYNTILKFASANSRKVLPRIVMDYLHFRQYAINYTHTVGTSA